MKYNLKDPKCRRHSIAFNAAAEHAATCHDCYVPIIDDEGNPKYISEACFDGAVILKELIAAESALWAK